MSGNWWQGRLQRRWCINGLCWTDDLANGLPCEDTFRRVLARLDPGAFEKCLLSWMQAVQEITENRMIAVDGKTLRGSYNKREGKATDSSPRLPPSSWAILCR